MTVLSPQPCYGFLSVSTAKLRICTVDSTSGHFLGVTTKIIETIIFGYDTCDVSYFAET